MKPVPFSAETSGGEARPRARSLPVPKRAAFAPLDRRQGCPDDNGLLRARFLQAVQGDFQRRARRDGAVDQDSSSRSRKARHHCEGSTARRSRRPLGSFAVFAGAATKVAGIGVSGG